MKKIFTISLFIISTISFAQLKVVKVEKADEVGKIQKFGGTVEAEFTKIDDVYTLRFIDIREQMQNRIEYRKITFKDVENTFEDLYSVIQNGFENTPEEDIMLELPDNYLFIAYDKFFGAPVVRITISTDKTNTTDLYSSNQFTKKQIEKLFGKR